MESSKTRKLCLLMEKLGADCFPVVAGRRGRPGYPDRIITMWGEVFWIEWKDTNTRVSPIQRAVIGRLRRLAEKRVFVARFLESGGILLEDADGEVLDSCDGDARSFLLMLKDWV